MKKILSTGDYTKVVRTFFAWTFFVGFSGLLFSTNIISTPEGIALVPSQALASTACEASTLDVPGKLGCLVKIILFSPAQLFSMGIGFAVTLIEYATNPSVFNKLFELPAVYTAWGVVRDIFNVIFIFVLLFSAFATIFRVQKYHLKNILLMVILMALLVNFSWPLAGLIIDFSNVLMLFFLGDQTGISLASGIGKESNFANTLLGEGGNPRNSDYTTLIMIDIFVFIFMVTMFAVAFQLFIRTIALLVLLIFSPIGIAGTAIPKMQGLSKMWWENFTRYAFTGPIAVFMLVFSAALMQDFTASTIEFDLQESSGSTSAPYGAELMTNIQKFIIPMVILWIGVIASSRLCDVGSKFVTSRARAFGSAAGKQIRRRVPGALLGTASVVSRGKSDQVAGTVAGKFRGVGAQFDNLQTRAAGRMKEASDLSQARYLKNRNPKFGGDPYAETKSEKPAVSKRAKEIAESEISAKQAASQYKTASGIEKKALAKYMTSKDALSSDTDLRDVLKAFEEDLKSNDTAKRADAVKNSSKALENLKDAAIEKFDIKQYSEIAKDLGTTAEGKKIVEELDSKLFVKKRYDVKTEFEIQNNGDPSAVIDKLTVDQIAKSEELAAVLARNKGQYSSQVTKAGSAIHEKIGSTPENLVQFNMRSKSKVVNDLKAAGINTEYYS